MKVALLAVPYHLGVEGVGVGAGPGALLEAGAARELEAAGHQVGVVHVRRPDLEYDELGAVVAIAAGLAEATAAALDDGALPVVLGGDCNTCLGALAAPAGEQLGLVWLDAHGDFNTPESSPSGFLDGMPLAMACGHCHTVLWAVLGGRPVREDHVVHVGGRDFDPEEQRRLLTSSVSLVPAVRLGRPGDGDELAAALAALCGGTSCRARRPGERRGARRVHVHVDIDVLDPTLAPAVDYPAPGGLHLDEVTGVISGAAGRLPVHSVSLTCLNPSLPDPQGLTLTASLEVLRTLVAAAGRSR